MARIVRFHQAGDADVLQVEDLPVPEPGEGEVLLRVKAIGLNRAEVLFRQGMYLVQPRFPSLIGYDAAGVIERCGPGVVEPRPGQRVNTIPTFSAADYGVYGEVAVVPAHAVTPIPDSVSFEQATTAGVQYHTVYYAMVELGQLGPGQWLLTTAASSSTGMASIELAKALGAGVIATTRTSAKRQALLDQGADAVIATEEEDLVAGVRSVTGERGVDVVFDPIGGAMLGPITEAAAPLGRVILYGLLDFGPLQMDPLVVLGKCLSIRGYQVFNFTGGPDFPQNPSAVERAIDFIYRGLQDGTLKAVVDRQVFALEAIAEAHRYMESNRQIGKIVVRTD